MPVNKGFEAEIFFIRFGCWENKNASFVLHIAIPRRSPSLLVTIGRKNIINIELKRKAKSHAEKDFPCFNFVEQGEI